MMAALNMRKVIYWKELFEHQIKLKTMIGESQTCLKMVGVYLALDNVCGSFGIFVFKLFTWSWEDL